MTSKVVSHGPFPSKQILGSRVVCSNLELNPLALTLAPRLYKSGTFKPLEDLEPSAWSAPHPTLAWRADLSPIWESQHVEGHADNYPNDAAKLFKAAREAYPANTATRAELSAGIRELA
jgi:hypothetical protein